MKKLVCLVSFAVLAAAEPAWARLVRFDLIPSQGQALNQIPSGWASFDWSQNFWWIDPAEDSATGTGYQYGMVSTPNVAFNAAGADVSFRRNAPFELVSFDLTAAWNNGLEVIVTGFRNGAQVNTTTFRVNASGPTLETLNWDVNRVTFHSFGGASAGYDGGINGTQFVLDNLTTMPISAPSGAFRFSNAIPEAPPWGMMLLGFAGLGLASVSSRKSRARGLNRSTVAHFSRPLTRLYPSKPRPSAA
jgi:hypothetical protein